MFISDLFEAQAKQTLVLIPGGFHPFHPGHLSLYRSAEQAFPGATIVYVATDDRKDRPFPFVEKQKLAQIAGVNPKNFQLVKSPFVAKEVTQNFDPNNTVLIFARSEKDRDEHPKPGGVKKDGSPSYLQPYTKGNLAPMSQHGYMAYLPTVEFNAGPSGVTSATQIRNMWPQADDAQKNTIVTDLYPKNPKVAKQILDKYLGHTVAEANINQQVSRYHPETLSYRQDTIPNSDSIDPNDMMVKGKRVDSYSHSDVDPTVDDGDPEISAQREQLKRLLPKALKDLDPKARQFITMRFYKDMTVPDIAKAFNVDLARMLKYQQKVFSQIAKSAHANDLKIAAEPMRVLDTPAFQLGYKDAANGHKPLNTFTRYTDRYLYDFGYQTRAKRNAGPQRPEMTEGSTAVDPTVIQMKKRARVAHPFAASDEEALALYISDREIRDVDNLEREQNRELKMIDRIQDTENKLQKEIERIDQELAFFAKSSKAK